MARLLRGPSVPSGSPWSQADPTGRFAGLAERYERYRPDYPPEAIDAILSRCSLHRGSVLVDVGCGTGISSRAFAARGLHVVGVEPNADMRGRALSVVAPSGIEGPTYRDGRAEDLGLPDGSADAVLAAQSFHWFAADRALAEFHRVLRQGGWVALMWNTHDEHDPFSAEYRALGRQARERSLGSFRDADSGAALRASPVFEDFEAVVFPHAQVLDEEGLVGRFLSASYAPKDPQDVRSAIERLQRMFEEHARSGRVVLRYRTEVYLARRREPR